MTIQPVPRSKKLWHKMRARHVTASEVAPLLGMGADYQQSPFALFHIKAGNVPAPEFDNDRMEAGNALESAIARWAARKEGWRIRRGCFAIDDHVEGASATLDFTIDPSDALAERGFHGPGALEIKNVDKWIYEDKWQDNEPPPHIALQHQQQLMCTGWSWGAVAVCIGGNELERIYYHARDGIITSLRETVADFWHRVRENRPYPVDHFGSTTDTLKALYKPRDEAHLDFSACAAEDLAALQKLADEFKALDERTKMDERRLDALKAEFRLRLGDHRTGGFPGFKLSRSVGTDTPARPATPGEMIPGRKGQDRLNISFPDPAKVKGKKGAVALSTANDALAEQVAA